MSETCSRRAALTGLGRVAALAFLPAGAAVAKTADIPAADARLIKLDRRHATLVEAARKAEDSFRVAEASVRRSVGCEPHESIDYSRSDCSLVRQLRAHEASVTVYQACKAQVQIKFCVAEMRGAYSDACLSLSIVEREVYETPAVGLAGLRAKARMAKRSSSLTYSVIQDLIAMEAANG